ncbi:MAG TPA: ROK family protein [Planctomycetota bacterium]|jgi:glucokinase|nr:ROK family protein [Planctomycetota bacterium]
MRGAVGIDLGGSFVKAVAVSPRGRVLARDRRPTEAARGAGAIVQNIAAAAGAVAERAGLRPPRRIGVGVPGVLERRRGVVLAAPNLAPLVGFPLRRALERATGARAFLENDANAAALGERWRGAGGDDFLLITLGTGVGGGLVLGGSLWIGPGGMAGEFGHVAVDAGGPRCGCGARGCVEAFASAQAVIREARGAIESGEGGSFVPRDGGDPDPAEVARAARQGDPRAKRIFEGAGRALGVGVASVVQLLDLRRFVVAGGLANALDLMLPALRSEVATRTFGRDAAKIEVLPSRLGEEGGTIGAARLALEGRR